jgi:hypothetical protein
MPARRHDASPARTSAVPSQFDQLTALICRTNARQTAFYDFKGSRPAAQPTDHARFDALVSAERAARYRSRAPVGRRQRCRLRLRGAYTFLDNVGRSPCCRPQTASFVSGGRRQCLSGALDARTECPQGARYRVRVDPGKVVHASYEGRQRPGAAAVRRDPGRVSAGMDVHAEFRFDAGRVAGSRPSSIGLERLQCTAGRARAAAAGRPRAAARLHAGGRAPPEFLRRGICARDPGGNEALMRVPRIRFGRVISRRIRHFFSYRPYAHHQRLFRTSRRLRDRQRAQGGGTPLFDILQPAVQRSIAAPSIRTRRRMRSSPTMMPRAPDSRPARVIESGRQ